MTANVSLLSGLEPLEIFPLLAPAILLLPVLSLYVLARRLWGPDYGLAAAAFAGLVLNGPYQYFSDAMYPNMFTSQFLLVLSIAGLLELYARPSVRTGLLFVLLGSSVVLYHQVASLYLVLFLIPDRRVRAVPAVQSRLPEKRPPACLDWSRWPRSPHCTPGTPT